MRRTGGVEDRAALGPADGIGGIRQRRAGRGEREYPHVMRVSLYARYSTDLQSITSIEDQFRICRDYAVRHGWEIVGTYADAAKSGTTMNSRPELLRLLEDAKRGKFDAVVTESLSRISRDQADMATIFKRLKFLEVKLVTKEDGEVTRMHIGMKGTMNEQFIESLGIMIHRGIEGRVLEGTVVQLPYGYNIVRRFKDDGVTVIKGEREINLAQAEIIRRIFREYAAGRSPIQIAARLEAEGIPGPKGKGWSASTIRGHPHNGTGILNNPLYIGKLVWNRARKVRNPDTDKETARLNAPDKWVTVDLPKLRIIDNDLWRAAKARQAEMRAMLAKQIEGLRGFHRANPGVLLNSTHRPRTPLSRLLWCGVCDSPITMRGKGYYGCSNHVGHGGCSNHRIVNRRTLEDRVVAGFRDLLIHPEVVATAMREYTDEINRLNREQTGSRGAKARLLDQMQTKIKEITLAIEDGGYSRALGDRLRELETRSEKLEAELAPVPVTESVPPAEEFRRRVEQLTETLQRPNISDDAWSLIRGLIDRIVILPDPEWGKCTATMYGDLAALVDHPSVAPDGCHFQWSFNVAPLRHRSFTAEHREKISKARKGRIPWNKGLTNALGAENGRKGAEKLRLIATGRKRHYRPDGSWTWVKPERPSA